MPAGTARSGKSGIPGGPDRPGNNAAVRAARTSPVGRVPAAKPLTAAFFDRGTVSVARALLGTVLIHDSPEGPAAGRIVETEAYLREDPACHAARGRTPRNAPMFGPPGRSYIYLIYGMYRCFNVVTAPEGVGEAVLIRALDPLVGVELMVRRRGTVDLRNLCSGPGKLVIALGLGAEHNDVDLGKGPVRLLAEDSHPWKGPKGRIKTATRIGITQGADLPLRFYLEGNPHVSRPG